MRKKFLIPLVILYMLSPIDLIPDLIPGLGQMDDLLVLLLGILAITRVSPPRLAFLLASYLIRRRLARTRRVPYRTV